MSQVYCCHCKGGEYARFGADLLAYLPSLGVPDLVAFAQQHNLKIITTGDLIRYRLREHARPGESQLEISKQFAGRAHKFLKIAEFPGQNGVDTFTVDFQVFVNQNISES